MGKWVGRISGAAIIGFVSYGGYVYFADGYHSRPELPAGAISFSFNSGLRAIATGIPEERHKRRYLGVPFDVPDAAKSLWSTCKPPTDEEAAFVREQIDMGPPARLDAICIVEVEGKPLTRGAIFSAPR